MGVEPRRADATGSLAASLVQAEERLRAHGWTGARAFDALVEALQERTGALPPGTASPHAREVVDALQIPAGADLLGLAYERFFPDLFKGRHGQFFTPGPIARLLVARLDLTPGQIVLDPTCGSGGLLVHAAATGAVVRGIELDPRLAKLARVGLSLAGIEADVRQGDLYATDPEPVDAIVANPPFSVRITDPDVLARYDLGRGRTSAMSEALFVEAIEGWVAPGGQAAVVLPFSVLVNQRYAPVRHRLATAWHPSGVCQLPEGVFRPFGGAAGRACLMWLRRRDCRRPVSVGWAEVRDPGYDVRLTRYKATGSEEIEARIRGEGWRPLPPDAWVPPPVDTAGRCVEELAHVREALRPSAPDWIADLADADKATGELSPRPAPVGVSGRVAIGVGDVLVARMRPELGNVAQAPDVRGVLAGSPEWIVLVPREHPGWLLHALRTPTWRQGLPVTGGQTRPRTHAGAVLASRVAWPGDAVAARVDRLSAHLRTARRGLSDRLGALQRAVDAFAAGEIDAAVLLDEVARLEDGG